MSARAPAKLTGALLARKGAAAPAGYAPKQGGGRKRGPGIGSAANTAVKLSLRLDADRHQRLRLTAAHLEASLQEILTKALDSYLDQLGAEVIRASRPGLNRTATTAKA